MSLISLLKTLFFPRTCGICGKKGAYLCAECLGNIPRLSQTLLSYEHLYALYSYREKEVQRLIRMAKYRGAFSALETFADPLSEFIFELIKKSGLSEQPIIVVPIPSTKASSRRRGFNQTEILARYVAHKHPNDVTSSPLLYRARKNRKQTECVSRGERIKNMENVFAIKPEANISPRAAYVLLDDVITTGATMRAAQTALTACGARAVFGVSIAYQENIT